MGSGDVLKFVIKDHGLFAEQHAGGFGPQVVATATLKAGVDFDGFLEMDIDPSKEVHGRPVLQVKAGLVVMVASIVMIVALGIVAIAVAALDV